MEGFFRLKTPADLREKLRRDFAKIEANLLDVDAFFNFFVTAEHMLDWIHPGNTKEQQDLRKVLRASSPLLKTCTHLANGAKHFRPVAAVNDSVSATGSGELQRSPFGLIVLGIFGFAPGRLVVDLKGQSARDLGPTIDAHDLAQRVLAYWDAYPLP